MSEQKVPLERLKGIWKKCNKCEVLINNQWYLLSTNCTDRVFLLYRRHNIPMLKPGDVVQVKLIHEAVYLFETQIRSADSTFYYLDTPRECKRIQRRGSFRLDVDVPVYYREKGKKSQKATVKDLSAGGLKMYHEEPIRVNSTIELEIQLGGDVVPTKGMVKRSEKTLNGFSSGVKFIDISKEKQETIIKYLFEEERKRRQRTRIRNF